jgi:hypothetical protein
MHSVLTFGLDCLCDCNNGNVIEESEGGSVQSKTYTYDSLNRVATASTIATNQPQWQGENVLAVCWGEQFGYDPWGNLLSISPASSAYTGCTQENLNVSVNTKNKFLGPARRRSLLLIAVRPRNFTIRCFLIYFQ